MKRQLLPCSKYKTFRVLGANVFGVNWGSKRGQHSDENDNMIGGAFAEYIELPASKVSVKPEGISHALAAAVALVGTTAYQGTCTLVLRNFLLAHLVSGVRASNCKGHRSYGVEGVRKVRGYHCRSPSLYTARNVEESP